MFHEVTLHWAECDKCHELYGHQDAYDEMRDLLNDMAGDNWYFKDGHVLCDRCREEEENKEKNKGGRSDNTKTN